MSRRRKLLLAGVSLGAALILTTLGFAALKAWAPRPFDADKWKAAAPPSNRCAVEGDPRHYMVGDLQDDHLSAGMTRRQVRNLLGKPSKTYERRDGKTVWRWPTALGFTRCFYFEVTFSRDQLVGAREYE